jgi:hypothetical protein
MKFQLLLEEDDRGDILKKLLAEPLNLTKAKRPTEMKTSQNRRPGDF